MKTGEHALMHLDLLTTHTMSYRSMIRTISILLILQAFLIPTSAFALADQGLSSVMSIIDIAIEKINKQAEPDENADPEQVKKDQQAATATVVNLSRTLGKLSFSRLQCGQADVLAEFTKRVQQLPQDYRDPMRDAFQEGFEQGKKETPLLSEDECARLTESRTRGDKEVQAKVDGVDEAKPEPEPEPEPVVAEDPKIKQMRIAELTGQLAYKRKFCGDKKVTTRDFNEVISQMPEEYQEEAKVSYWKGYKHGKRLNKGLTKAKCQ
jgi:predicted secreted protein